MNDASRRTIRTFLQVGLVQGVLQLYDAFAVVKLTTDQAASITLVATPIVGLLQNLLEDRGALPPLLKPATVETYVRPYSPPRVR